MPPAGNRPTGHLEVEIGGRTIGPGHPTYVIAELSANHEQDLGRARALVRMAAEAGVDAVKLQTYTPDTMTIESDQPSFRIGPGTIWEGRTLYDLYGEAMTPWEWHEPLLEEAHTHGIALFSTPFDQSAVRFLDDLGMAALKIASFELIDLELVALAAGTGRPLLMSTGMATVDEIDDAVRVARAGGCDELVLLRCNSAYPAPPGEMDVCTVVDMVERWGVPVGLSDHSLTPTASLAAVALGACVVEKHVTFSRAEPGPDAEFSLEPDELRDLVSEIRRVEEVLGQVRYGPTEREKPSLAFRRSLFAVADIAAGESFTRDNVRSIRPAGGLPPSALPSVLGRRAATTVRRGTPIEWALVAE